MHYGRSRRYITLRNFFQASLKHSCMQSLDDFRPQSMTRTTTKTLQVISRITPISGPAEAAGTAVTFYGRGFVNSTKLACRFGLAPPVTATFISPNELFCESPPLSLAVMDVAEDDDGRGGLRWSSLSEVRQREVNPLTGSRQLFPGAYYYPLFSQRAVGVEVSSSLVIYFICYPV